MKIMHSCYDKRLNFNIRKGLAGLSPISTGTKSGYEKLLIRLTHILQLQISKNASKPVVIKNCNVRESNPGLPRGRREFYH